MDRKPSKTVRRKLRKEVGFGCPVPDCGNPYLTWHHFDPPWAVKEHHNPEGMIALCQEHHAKADAGAFTIEQLRQFKKEGATQNKSIKGRFDWMRQDLVAVIGGNIFLKTPTVLEVNGNRVIWFRRDKAGYLLLNLNTPTIAGEERTIIEDNFWMTGGDPVDIECPPSGRLLDIRYPNGDMLKIEFREIASQEFFQRNVRIISTSEEAILLPITAVEITAKISELNIDLGPDWLHYFKFTSSNVLYSKVYISIDTVKGICVMKAGSGQTLLSGGSVNLYGSKYE